MKMLRVLAALAALSASPAIAQTVDTAPPPAPYAKVSDLVPLPDFLPGIGQLYVDPATLPAGPFLAYDHDGRLVATIFMVPIAALEAGTTFDDLAVPGGPIDHVVAIQRPRLNLTPRELPSVQQPMEGMLVVVASGADLPEPCFERVG